MFQTNGQWYKHPCLIKLTYGQKKIHWQDIEHKGDNRINKWRDMIWHKTQQNKTMFRRFAKYTEYSKSN